MKKNLKKAMFALVCMFSVALTAAADREKPITVNELPVAAQQLMKKHFAGHQVALAKVEPGLIEKSYDVIFTNGDKLEFERNGNWTEISCKTAIPAALVPQAIAAYVKEFYPAASVLSIEVDREGYDVKLSNRLEVTFNKKFQVVDIDN